MKRTSKKQISKKTREKPGLGRPLASFQPLPAPLRSPDGGVELLRLAIDAEHRTAILCQRAFDEPFMWGLLLVDMARHISRIYALENRMTDVEALSQIRQGFAAELANPSTTVVTGMIPVDTGLTE